MISLMNTSICILEESSNEEEKETNEEKEKETNEEKEKEEDKKEFFLSFLVNSNFYNTTSVTVIFFVEITSSFSIEIQLPPPEYIV